MIKIAGIVLFNPSIERLQDNVSSILKQVDKLLLVDNCSENILEVIKLYGNVDKIDIVLNNANVGIAKALNEIAEYAFNNNASWVLSLDQDSVAPANILSCYEENINMKNVGMICCRICDRNLNNDCQTSSTAVVPVSNCITSGCFIKLEAWDRVGKYYEPLFIDQVDFDMCYSLIESGYTILCDERVILLHEVGKSTEIRLFGRPDVVTNHPPIRYYYIFRNYLAVARRHGHWGHFLMKLVRRFIIVNKYEDEKRKKNKMIFWGIVDGIRGNLGGFSH